MNSVNLIGRLTTDPDLYRNSNGRFTVTLEIAVDDHRTGGREPMLLTIVAHDHRAEVAGRYLRRGRLIAVEGRLEQVVGSNQHRRWQKHQVVASAIDFLDDRPATDHSDHDHVHAAPHP